MTSESESNYDPITGLFLLVYFCYRLPPVWGSENVYRCKVLGRNFVESAGILHSYHDASVSHELLGGKPRALVCTCGKILSHDLSGVRHGCQNCKGKALKYSRPYLAQILESEFGIHPSWTEWAQSQVILSLLSLENK